MERGADICRGKLAGAAGSSQPRARSLPARRRGKQTLRACEPRLLTSAFFLNIPPRPGSEELSCRKSKCTKQSQQEIHILPKARAKWDHRAASSRSGGGGGAVGLCEANLGSNRSKGCLYGPDLEHTEIKGRAQLGLKEGPETVPLSVLFSECVQKITESSHLGKWFLAVLQWFSAVPGTSKSTYGTYLLAAVLYPQLFLTKCIHSSLSW